MKDMNNLHNDTGNGKLLVVVDMQKDFVTGCLGTDAAKATVRPIAEYIRNFDGNVVFTMDTHGVEPSDDPCGTQTGEKGYLETQEGRRLPVPHCLCGTDGFDLVPELKCFMPAHIYYKETFGSRNLMTSLMIRRPNVIEFCGVCTGICVISNAVIAKTALPEAEIRILSNLCACISPESHANALRSMHTLQMDIVRVGFTDGGTSEEIINPWDDGVLTSGSNEGGM